VPNYGPRIDPETGAQHAPVAQATDYTRLTPLRHIEVAGGTIDVHLVRSPTPGARVMTRVHARYTLEGDPVDQVVTCRDEHDEATTLRRLEQEMRAAQTRPTP
jgi:hypothetical protein